MFKKILVAYDSSEESRKAVKIAGYLANKLSADLWIVVAFDSKTEYYTEPNAADLIDARFNLAAEQMKDAINEIGSISGSINTEILEGPPADAIISVARTRRIELVIMGTRGDDKPSDLLVGSQSQMVISNAGCPVLLAP